MQSAYFWPVKNALPAQDRVFDDKHFLSASAFYMIKMNDIANARRESAWIRSGTLRQVWMNMVK